MTGLKRFHIAAATLLTIALTAFGGCRLDIGGVIASWSTPDERFAASREMPDPLWTAPVPAGPFSFVFITDCHIVDRDTSRLARLVPALAGDSFLVLGGDLVQDGQAEDFQALADWRATVPIPVYAAIGNHDLYKRGWNVLRAILPQSSYTLSIGAGFRLVVLDSGNATLGKEQFRWLSSALEAAREPAVVLVSHYPLFDTGFGEINSTDPEESAALIKLLSRRHVDLMLTGHTHRKANRNIGGTAYVTGESSRVQDGARQAIRVTVDGEKVSWTDFPLP